jgi:hypothetical protein
MLSNFRLTIPRSKTKERAKQSKAEQSKAKQSRAKGINECALMTAETETEAGIQR